MVKKGIKMHLSEFQADETFGPSLGGGSWADDDAQDVFSNLPLASQSQRGGFEDDRTGGDWRAGPQRDANFASREPVPIPDSPPYTARLINIDYSASELEIEQLFSGDNFKTVSVRLPKDITTGRIRGYAFVEFSDRESLVKALAMDGEMFLKRPLRVLVAERREDDRFEGNWRSNRSGPLPALSGERGPREGGGRGGFREEVDDLRNYDSWERRGPLPSRDDAPRRSGGRGFREEPEEDGRDYDKWEHRGPLPAGPRREFSGPRREFSGPRRDREYQSGPADTEDNWRSHKSTVGGDKPSRPRLNLQPRKVSADSSNTNEVARSASLFGAAIPVDTSKKEQEIGDRQAKIDEKKHKQREDRQEKKTEQTRKGFEALSTEDDVEEEKEQSTEGSKQDSETKTEVEAVADAPVAHEELETGEWETVAKKGAKK